MRFTVDENLLCKARAALAKFPRVYWVVGGSCVGKSTVCRALADPYSLQFVDMDVCIFDAYPRRYTPRRHPANSFWFAEGNGLAWVLSLTWEEFDAFNRAADAEYLDLFADDLAKANPDRAILVDGGISHPEILARVLPPGRIACLEIDETLGTRIWEEDAERQGMKEAIRALPDPQGMWAKFLLLDTLMRRNIAAECRASGIATFPRTANLPLRELVDQVARRFGFGSE